MIIICHAHNELWKKTNKKELNSQNEEKLRIPRESKITSTWEYRKMTPPRSGDERKNNPKSTS